MRLAGILLAGVLACLACPARAQHQAPGAGPGFVLLDFKTQANVNLGQWLKWVYPGSHPNNPNPHPGPSGSRRGAFGPITMMYAVDSGFMSNQSPETYANAKAAVESALRTWSEATNGYLRFTEAPWPAVLNITNDPVNYPFPHFTGPGLSHWCSNYACPACQACSSVTLFPGLGAEIDFFTRPTGWQFTSNGFTYTMSSGILGFTAVHRSADGIWIVDIYLNRDFNWTTDPALARTAGAAVKYHCDLRSPVSPILPADGAAAELGASVYDIETVVLHELGHALGLDHPNEACAKGAAVLDPYTREFLPCSSVTQQCVMYGAYNGVKRELAAADIGGLAFLYRPRKLGDVNADDRITIADAAYALHLFQNPDEANPYEVSALDFGEHNGRIDLDETLMVLYWVLDPATFPAFRVLDSCALAANRATTTLTLGYQTDPDDIGLEKQFELTLTLDNPDQLAVTGWDLQISYDPVVFSNPVVTGGAFLPGGTIAVIPSAPGELRIAKVGFPPGDQSSFGSLMSVRFDVSLAAAAMTPDIVHLPLTKAQFVIADPVNGGVRAYGDAPGDTLVVDEPQVMSYLYDADGNECVDVDDAYEFAINPVDVTKNGVINETDRKSLNEGVRRRELPVSPVPSP